MGGAVVGGVCLLLAVACEPQSVCLSACLLVCLTLFLSPSVWIWKRCAGKASKKPEDASHVEQDDGDGKTTSHAQTPRSKKRWATVEYCTRDAGAVL